MTEADLCRLPGVSAPHLTQLENGARTTISLRKIRELAGALDCDPRALHAGLLPESRLQTPRPLAS